MTMSSKASAASIWWQAGTIYQIYPRSFQDSNGDGIGDLKGIIGRLPYLHQLGVDAIWISPIFPSPMADFGYDISDYVDIHPLFGTLADFDALVEAAHAQGLRVILDLVPNHTSDEHPWFIESRSSRDNPKRDWYIWQDPKPDGSAPTNWLSEFGGSAWQYDEASGQYYYHAFLDRQPDLNWRNPDVRDAIYEVMRFWMRRGVDGFRVDVIWHLIKDDQYRDNPVNPNYVAGRPPHETLITLYSADRPETQDVVAEMRQVIDEFEDRVLIGEVYLPIDRLVAYYGEDLGGAHLPFNFALLSAPWNARDIADLIARYEAALPLGAWPNWVLGNHDRPRVATRVGDAQARVAAMLLLTLRGTPTLYYGDEIGMRHVPIAPEQVQDPFEKNVPGIGVGRDGCRTPMQWASGENAGFTAGMPWLPLDDDFHRKNAATLAVDPRSILSLYVKLIALRKRMPELVFGNYDPVETQDAVLAYRRSYDNQSILIALNFTGEPASLHIGAGEVLISTELDREGENVPGPLELRGNEGVIVRLRS
ncbi:alpha-amylase family glycosyl hydrolase [Tardiphaga sp.]|jgi:alpha-glucosidase|uniref:alpha-amylase family glycosyl hydrolase n=1 Tax=Tardiphaga sp. TaxID=1926292 RepID=UPI0037DA73C7